MPHVGNNVKNTNDHLITCFQTPSIRNKRRILLKNRNKHSCKKKHCQSKEHTLENKKRKNSTYEHNKKRKKIRKPQNTFWCASQMCNVNTFLQPFPFFCFNRNFKKFLCHVTELLKISLLIRKHFFFESGIFSTTNLFWL